ncbi:MAG: response regulator [Bacteroidota bacterium]|nr:response regulator [Bacteroidota bacterium]MDX5430629.1 response regulator [Bacteroidota bacterium]MDX5469379.1 response regulator [Bacteroidota bacterium]
MKLVIIEDEHLIANELMALLQQCLPDLEAPEVIESVEAGLAWFKEHPMPDLIMSDIQLSDGVSFDIFEKMEIMAPVIFTTAYDEYALRAFKLNSIDYLLKPIRKQDLMKALEKFKRFQGAMQPDLIRQQFEHLLSDLKTGKKYKTRFSAHQGQSMVPVQLDKVAGFVKDELIFLLTRT